MYDLRLITNVSGHLVAFVNGEVVATAIPDFNGWRVNGQLMLTDEMRIALIDAQIARMKALSESGQVGSIQGCGSIEA